MGVVLERGVIRRLYGRPLETLLLTWGASLIIQQGLRLWFGAANVDVSSPRWLSGGFALMTGLTLPFNRLFIIGARRGQRERRCTGCSSARTAGSRIRAVTQNRAMSACLGVRAGAVDALHVRARRGARRARGLRAHADRQRGPVARPELHRRLVHGRGDGRRRASSRARSSPRRGIGGLNKGIEPALGAVFAQGAILIAVILFLQRRPAGLFAAKGRNAEA